jgi:predicted unusual protein kinase regulating ubiquinone biosynthesis (AarF/ABC1/UbiB family)
VSNDVLYSFQHPGNIMISPDNKIVLLDVGIVVENNERDYALISDILSSFIRMDGRKAGQLMIDDSNAKMKASKEKALHEEQFVAKIGAITDKANGKNYFMEHLGTYITQICNAAAMHHVMINQAFISACLAVKLQEGVALALDPSIEIWRIAIPIILEGERRRGMIAKRATELVGLSSFFGWTAEKSDSKGRPAN